MKKFALFFVGAAMLSLNFAYAQTAHFKCFERRAPEYFVVLAVDSAGKIVQMNAKKFVLADAHGKSPFSYLSQNLEESPFESIKSIQAPNGYSIVTFITTADAISVGISKERSKGFYSYQDIGSGNGNSRKELVCQSTR